MSPRPAIIDTNVVVSGLLTRDPSSPTARILDGMLGGGIAFLLSPELFAEYRSVLLRPHVPASAIWLEPAAPVRTHPIQATLICGRCSRRLRKRWWSRVITSSCGDHPSRE